MIALPLDCTVPVSRSEAVSLSQQYSKAKILAGGQSLIPSDAVQAGVARFSHRHQSFGTVELRARRSTMWAFNALAVEHEQGDECQIPAIEFSISQFDLR